MRIKARRPSAGVVIGTVALVFAVTGAAVALPGTNTVNSGDIKNKSVTRNDQALNQRTDWALIKLAAPNPTIIKQSGGVSIASGFAGAAYVDFNRSVASRPIVAQSVWPDDGPNEAGLCGEGAQGIQCDAVGTNNRQHIYVEGDINSRVYLTVLPK